MWRIDIPTPVCLSILLGTRLTNHSLMLYNSKLLGIYAKPRSECGIVYRVEGHFPWICTNCIHQFQDPDNIAAARDRGIYVEDS